MSEDVAKDFQGEYWEFQRYVASFHEAIFQPLRPETPDVKELESFFVQAYKRVSGTD